ncbi:hypothetical protein NVP1170O_112 [Vibrio phage 1.170.O._10N.261.52.C3]|nr:hypothetical protein NVP1170O_112 [Vibrio phage 1.170.O._10N.261.52.C3]
MQHTIKDLSIRQLVSKMDINFYSKGTSLKSFEEYQQLCDQLEKICPRTMLAVLRRHNKKKGN